ncbi:hypothetical protein LTR56_010393 [Elasticomyces elasticus]|nr:hypothetical protein LTR22_024406 [Elasticomyces elasticus]KAK3643019.1 hypothetical protein LTR56_010393 [Elasticomyces elasticus]KAK4916824.1 hypothetical protein LTR49_015268 [Elasticomyces elasticus]KAK5755974.1 hypothetical protein LTS12_013978 [Elasticomyces elasticus]
MLLRRAVLTPPRLQRRHLSTFAPGDLALLRPTKSDRNNSYASPILTKPLSPTGRVETHKGIIPHSAILGKQRRDVVRTNISNSTRDGRGKGSGGAGGQEYRLHEVKLEEYVRLTRRLVTPLYPQDAGLIVGLLDLHPEPPRWGDGKEGEKLEILEAGTGHGALTLYLSRAVHGANMPFPRSRQEEGGEEDGAIAVEQWKASRNAVIHSIEISDKYSSHARTVVDGFRHGMYTPNVDFHVGSVSDITSSLLTSRNNQPFLSHAFLDLPGTEQHLGIVAKALKVDGALIVFCPSITQVMACLETVKTEGVGLEMERVLELGVNGGTGGREWDVRAVRPRAARQHSATGMDSVRDGDGENGNREDSGVELSSGGEEDGRGDKKDEGWKMICRPKVGELVVGGGFLGVFRKKRL